MKLHRNISIAAILALFLCESSLAIAREQSAGKDQSAAQGPSSNIRTSKLVGKPVLDLHGNKLGHVKDVIFDPKTGQATFLVLDAIAPGSSHPMTYSAARPIDNISAPGLPPTAVQNVMPAPCMPASDSGWTRDLEDFYNE